MIVSNRYTQIANRSFDLIPTLKSAVLADRRASSGQQKHHVCSRYAASTTLIDGEVTS